MQSNAFAGGANTTGVGRRGRGNRGGNRRAGGGGGGGGGGGNKVPKGGLYGGRAGEAAANQQPEVYLESLLRQTGAINDAGTDFDTFMRDVMIPNIMGGYQQAVAGNQRLSLPDYIRQTYGAGWSGKRGQQFASGSLGMGGGGGAFGAGSPPANAPGLTVGGAGAAGTAPAGPGGRMGAGGGPSGTLLGGILGGSGGGGVGGNPLATQYNRWWANQNPMAYATTDAMRTGHIASNGNQQYQDWYQQVYTPQLEAQWRNQQRDNPQANFSDFMAAQDPNAARQQYAYRAPSQRQPTGAPTTGRWSWWA